MTTLDTLPLLMAAWYYVNESIRHGGEAFKHAHGSELWELAASGAEFNKLYNQGLVCTNKTLMGPIIDGCKEVFMEIGYLVEVGGGTNTAVAEIVRSHPHIIGINFDQTHVVATAPDYEGVVHLRGDMHLCIPAADAFFMKFVLRTRSDEDCLKILKNCRKATAEGEERRVLITEVVFEPESDDRFHDVGMVFDIAVMVLTSGGKERAESEWKKLLEGLLVTGSSRSHIYCPSSKPSLTKRIGWSE